MDIRRQLGLNVQRIRRERKWSQEELAFESGLHRTYISGSEQGARNPRILVITRLADGLNVEPDVLFLAVDQGTD